MLRRVKAVGEVLPGHIHLELIEGIRAFCCADNRAQRLQAAVFTGVVDFPGGNVSVQFLKFAAGSAVKGRAALAGGEAS